MEKYNTLSHTMIQNKYKQRDWLGTVFSDKRNLITIIIKDSKAIKCEQIVPYRNPQLYMFTIY